MIVFSFNQSNSLSEFTGFSFRFYKEAFSNDKVIDAFKDDFVEVQKCMNIYKIDLSKELYLWCGNDKIRIFAIILR